MQECPRCGAHLEDAERICRFCNRDLGDRPALSAEAIIARERRSSAVSDSLLRHLVHMPLLTLHHPPGWSFRPLALVTAQSVSGTGFASEIAASLSDVFGGQSGAFQGKLRGGEETCKASLRLDALRLGAHAVIGVDVKYAEVGHVKSMLMVCMSGTAVRLDDPGVLEPAAAASVVRAGELLAKLKE